jgi:hypothetical protein
MLEVKESLAKAERNRNFILQKLLQIVDKYPDWVTIVAFYCALHFVDAHLLRHHSIQREHHEERARDVAIYMQDIYPAYKRLFDMGFRARYQRIEDSPTKDEAQSVVDYDLPEVEAYVKQRMA